MPELIGQPVNRVDGTLKVTGRATYAYEHKIPNAAYGLIVSSTIAKGRIKLIDTAAALRVPGVLTVMTHLNAPKLPTVQQQQEMKSSDRIIALLQDDVVRYSSQPVALVVAEMWEAALEAAQRLKVEYAVEEPVTSLASRAAQAYAPKKGGEPSATTRGDMSKGLSEAAQKISEVYGTPFEVHNPMEPHATIAVWGKDGHLTLYDSTQGVFSCRGRIASLFSIPPEHIHVLSPFLGGGFGSKGPAWSHVALAAMAARQLNRPVKLELQRQQMFGNAGMRSQTRQTLKAGAKQDGTLTALSHDTLCHTSTFDEFLEKCSNAARMLYRTPNNATTQKLVQSDIGTPSFMRAPGEAPGTYALEAAMDEMAYELRMDPVEFRLKNYAEQDPQENRPWSSKSLRECYRKGAEKFGWSARKLDPRSMREGNELVGWGMATSVYPTNRSAATATAKLDADGTVAVDSGTQDLGTGTYTVMTQVAAGYLGVPVKAVKFRLGDTYLPKAPSSGGSQTAASVGSAVELAAQALREKLIQLAISNTSSPLAGLSAQDIEVADGKLSSRSNPSKSVTLQELLKATGTPSIESKAEAKPGDEKERYSMYAFGAQFAEVRVDADLGQIRVARLIGCFAAGKILNAQTARSQFLGGMVWGIGMALEEAAVLDGRYGRFVNNNLAEYHIPVNADVAQIEAIWVDEKDEHVNPLGVKGVGEIGITGAAAAIANAVFHATGKRVRQLPITLDTLLA